MVEDASQIRKKNRPPMIMLVPPFQEGANDMTSSERQTACIYDLRRLCVKQTSYFPSTHTAVTQKSKDDLRTNVQDNMTAVRQKPLDHESKPFTCKTIFDNHSHVLKSTVPWSRIPTIAITASCCSDGSLAVDQPIVLLQNTSEVSSMLERVATAHASAHPTGNPSTSLGRHCSTTHPSPFILISLVTCVRLSELLALRKKDLVPPLVPLLLSSAVVIEASETGVSTKTGSAMSRSSWTRVDFNACLGSKREIQRRESGVSNNLQQQRCSTEQPFLQA